MQTHLLFDDFHWDISFTEANPFVGEILRCRSYDEAVALQDKISKAKGVALVEKFSGRFRALVHLYKSDKNFKKSCRVEWFNKKESYWFFVSECLVIPVQKVDNIFMTVEADDANSFDP